MLPCTSTHLNDGRYLRLPALVMVVFSLVSCDLLVGPPGPAGPEGAESPAGSPSPAIVYGSFEIIQDSPSGMVENWFVIVDTDLNFDNGFTAVDSGHRLPGSDFYSYYISGVPQGSYYIYAFLDGGESTPGMPDFVLGGQGSFPDENFNEVDDRIEKLDTLIFEDLVDTGMGSVIDPFGFAGGNISAAELDLFRDYQNYDGSLDGRILAPGSPLEVGTEGFVSVPRFIIYSLIAF